MTDATLETLASVLLRDKWPLSLPNVNQIVNFMIFFDANVCAHNIKKAYTINYITVLLWQI